MLPGGESDTYVMDDLVTPNENVDKKQKYNVILCVIGGITQAELSAIR